MSSINEREIALLNRILEISFCRRLSRATGFYQSPMMCVGDMSKSPSSQYDLKAQEDIDPKGIRVTNGPMR